MNVTHLGDRTVMDTQALAVLTGRSPHSIRTVCSPREPNGYDVTTCVTALKANPYTGRVMTAAQTQKYLGIPAGTVRYWASRGWLVLHDRDHRGSPLYDATQILDLARRLDR